MYVWRVGREARARRRAGASMGCVRQESRESRERIQCTRGTQLAAGGPGGKVGRSVASVDGPLPREERLRAHECHTQLPKKAVEFTPQLSSLTCALFVPCLRLSACQPLVPPRAVTMDEGESPKRSRSSARRTLSRASSAVGRASKAVRDADFGDTAGPRSPPKDAGSKAEVAMGLAGTERRRQAPRQGLGLGSGARVRVGG